jgi:hypothetical protein
VELFCIAYVIDFVWLVCFLGLTDVLGFMNPLRWLRLRPLSEATAMTRARTKADPYGMTNKQDKVKRKGVGGGNSARAQGWAPGIVRSWCSFEVYFGWSAGWGGGESEGEL